MPDVNLLLFAYREGVPQHSVARDWWESLLNGREDVGIPWAVISGFVRQMTNPRTYRNPNTPTEAFDFVDEWFGCPNVRTLDPGPRHLELFRRNLEVAGVGGNLTADAHIAALAMEYQAELHSHDSDFGRFPGLMWRDPL